MSVSVVKRRNKQRERENETLRFLIKNQDEISKTTSIDDELVKRAQDGDLLAQERVLRRCEGIVRSLAKKSTIRPLWLDSNFEDLAQEARIAVWRQALPKFNPNLGASFLTHAWWWARSAVSSELKKMKNRDRVKLQSDCSEGDDEDGEFSRGLAGIAAAPVVSESIDLDKLVVHVCKLPTDERHVIWYRFWENKSVREIASLSGDKKHGLPKKLNRQAVCDLTEQALDKLRDLFGAAKPSKVERKAKKKAKTLAERYYGASKPEKPKVLMFKSHKVPGSSFPRFVKKRRK